jgi:branched-chain amino acid transport system substrate-binding protein
MVMKMKVKASLIRARVAVTLLTLLIAISAFTIIPNISSVTYKTVKIGVIASASDTYDIANALFKEKIEPEINTYMEKLPSSRFNPKIKFEFVIENANANADTHLEIMKKFKKMGIDLVIGGFWSPQAEVSLDYINENGMLLLSPSSTSPLLAIAGDNLFRLCPPDTRQAKAMAEMVSSRGIENVVEIVHSDSWGIPLSNAFGNEYTGNIIEVFTYDPIETEFDGILEAADAAVSGYNNVGVLLISFNEASTILFQAEDNDVYDLPWFGSDGTAYSSSLSNDAYLQADHVKLYSTVAAATYSTKYYQLNEWFEGRFGYSMGFYYSCYADAAWILTQAVLETKPSMQVNTYNAKDVIRVFPDVCYRYFGYSGWCNLNEAGDRSSPNYDILGYKLTDNHADCVRYGYYDGTTGEVTWLPP